MFRFIDLFAGIGGFRLAFESAGCQCVFSSEWNKYAQKTYFANFDEMPHGDITQIAPESIPDHDILLAGFPCQPFSEIGKQGGFSDTRGTAFFDIERILMTKKPRAFLLENVKKLYTHDNGRTMNVIISHLEALGYFVHIKVMNSLNFGVPQRRKRLFIVGFNENIVFNFPPGQREIPSLNTILEKNVDPKLFVSTKIKEARLERCRVTPFYPSVWQQNKIGKIFVYPFCGTLLAYGTTNHLLVNGERRLSEREMLRLQGFPDSFKIVVSYTKVVEQAGNSITVPLVAAIAREMLKSMTDNTKKQDYVFFDSQLTF